MAVDSPTASAAHCGATLPPLPPLLDPHTPLSAYSSTITTLHTLAKQSSTRAELVAELVASADSSASAPLSAVCPLLLHSFRRLRQCAAARCGGELQLARQLWTALRNVVTVRAAQSAFVHCAAFRPLLSCLSELCALPSECSATAPLLLVGCQLLANTVAGNSDTQSVFARHYLLSADLLAIVRSCPSSCLSPLLYAVHTLLLSSAGSPHTAAAQRADGTALFAELTLRFGQQHQRREAGGEADDEDANDGDSSLLFPSLAHRLFLQDASLLTHMSDHLELHHPAQHHAGLTFLLSSLCTVSSCALETESAAECATVNCVSLLSLLLARHPIDASERIEDDEGQYALLPSTLQVDEWTHSSVLLVEHVLASCLAHQHTAASQLPLLRRLLSADVWYLLLSLLSSTNTPTHPPAHESSSSSSVDSPIHSVSFSRPPVPFGFQSDLLRLLCLLASYPSEQPPPFPRVTAVSFLAHTAIDPSQPMQREYSVVGIRGLCRWEEARQALASMECQAVAGADEWRRQGVQLTLEPHSHKVRLASSGGAAEEKVETAQSEWQQQSEQWTQTGVERGEGDADMWSVERMAAVRSAGRRVDWGDADSDEPFDPDTDFM